MFTDSLTAALCLSIPEGPTAGILPRRANSCLNFGWLLLDLGILTRFYEVVMYGYMNGKYTTVGNLALIISLILAAWGLVLFHEWVVLQETNSVVACEEASVDSSFCVTWYKTEFNRIFPS